MEKGKHMKTEIKTYDIDKLCQLSYLEFDEEHKQILLNEVQSITDMLGKLADVKEDKAFVLSEKLTGLREDKVCESMKREDVFLNAPNSSNGYFVVPKVVD